MSGPHSRLSDDLYSLYLAGIVWLLLPVYGNGLAIVLPSDVAGFAATLDVISAAVIAGAGWIGYRGGPFLLHRSSVLHELGSPQSRRRTLVPRLLRQGVAYAALSAIAVTTLLAVSDAEAFGFAEAARSSVVAMLAMLVAVVQAVGWLVVWKGNERPVGVIAINLVVLVAVTATVAAGVSLASPVGFAVLAVSLVASATMTWRIVEAVPVDHLWRRASALEDMRSAMVSFDFQQVLVSLRRAVDHSEDGPPRHLTRQWMPLQLWRYIASIQQGFTARIGQFALSALVVALLVALADPSDGVVALAIAGVGFLAGVELSSPVASTAGQVTFLVHYPQGSMSVLRRQVVTAVLLGVTLGLVAVGWLFFVDPVVAGSVLALFAFGTLAAAAQGRMGSPDVAQIASKLGPSGIGPVLWMRALLGPILVVALTIVVSQRWLHPDTLRAPWETFAILIVVSTFVVATYPLEQRAS